MKIRVIESCGSTNEELKSIISAMPDGVPLPTALLAAEQTAGKGRFGRSFASARGKGLYLSIPLRLSSPEDALCIMPMTSVCVCREIERSCGIKCDIKWPNDILFRGKKLCGILTELIFRFGVPYLIIGIGINLDQEEDDFPEELKGKAISVKQACGIFTDRMLLAGKLTESIESMIKALPDGKAEYLDYYRKHCCVTGKEINVLFSESSAPEKARAIGITDDFRLLVMWEDGRTEILDTGEVSVRGDF